MTVIYAGSALVMLGVVFYGCFRISKDPPLGVCLFVFLSSITMSPHLPVVGDRLVFADFVMLFTLLVCAIKGYFFRPPPPGLKLIDQVSFLFITLATISSLLVLLTGTDDPARLILFLIIYAYGYCCFRIIIRLVRDRETFERVMIWWFAGAALVVGVGFLASTGIYRPAWTFDPVIGRINSTFKMSGQVASYLGPALFIMLYLVGTRRLSRMRQLGVLALTFAGSFVLLGAGSRIAFVMMVFSIGVGTWVILTSSTKGIRRVPLIIATTSATVGLALFSIAVWTDTSIEYGLTTTSPFERAIKIWSEQTGNGLNVQELGGTRYHEVSIVLENFDQALLTGVGSGMFSQTYETNEVHNTYFSILAENGLPAFIVFIWWWVLMFVLLQRSITRANGENRLMIKLAFWAFAMLAIYQITTNGMRQRPFWFVPALAITSTALLRHPNQLSSRRKMYKCKMPPDPLSAQID